MKRFCGILAGFCAALVLSACLMPVSDIYDTEVGPLVAEDLEIDDHPDIYNNISKRPPAFAVKASAAGATVKYQWYMTDYRLTYGSPDIANHPGVPVKGATSPTFDPASWTWGYDMATYADGTPPASGSCHQAWFYYCKVWAEYVAETGSSAYTYTGQPLYSNAAKAQIEPAWLFINLGESESIYTVFYLPTEDRFVVGVFQTGPSGKLKRSAAGSVFDWDSSNFYSDRVPYVGAAAQDGGFMIMWENYPGSPTPVNHRATYFASTADASGTDIGSGSTSFNSGYTLVSLCYGGGYFLGVGDDTSRFGYVLPGQSSWGDAGAYPFAAWTAGYAVAYGKNASGKGRFVVGSSDSNTSYLDASGLGTGTWSAQVSTGLSGPTQALAYGEGIGGGRFVAMYPGYTYGTKPAEAAYSQDGGEHWQPGALPSGFYLDTGYTQPKLAAGNGAFVAAGSDNNYSPTAYLAAWSTDGGKNWQVIDFSGGSGALFSAAYGTPGGVPTFVVAGAGGKAWMIR